MKKLLYALLILTLTLLLCGAASSESELKLPDDTKSIGAQAFYGDQSLDTVILPEGLETIGSKAFVNSTVNVIYLPESITSIASDAFSGCKVIGYGKKDGTYAANFFSTHSGLIYVRQTSASFFTYKDIGTDTCKITGYTGSIKEIMIPKTSPEGKKVIAIGWQAFQNNEVITKVAIPEGVTDIETNAFYGCPNLTQVCFPESLRKIGFAVFYGCSKLASVELPEHITEAEEWSAATIPYTVMGSETAMSLGKADSRFRIHGLNADLRYIFSGTDTVELALINADNDIVTCNVPEGVNVIGYREDPFTLYKAFNQCKNLETVKLPSTLTRIEEQAFSKCTSLQYIALPSGVRSIGEKAFVYCTSLYSAVLSVNLESIGDLAFAYCENLKSITITANVTEIGGSAFWNSGVETFWIVAEHLTGIDSTSLVTDCMEAIYCYTDTATWNKLSIYKEYADLLKPYNAQG